MLPFDPRSLPLLTLAATLMLGCGDDLTATDDEAGSTTNAEGQSTGSDSGDTDTDTDTGMSTETGAVCGDGVVDPGEVCDDGNRDDADGCTSTCEFGPCAFEWIRRESTIEPDLFGGMTLDGASMLVLTDSTAPTPYRTQLVQAAQSDGAIEATTDLGFGADGEWVSAFALDPGGDLFMLSQLGDWQDGDLHVARVSDAQTLWQVSRSSRYSLGLGLSGAGELLFASTESIDNTDSDARLTALDPNDGVELWTASFSGAVAANGYSLDRGVDLVAGDGAIFLGLSEYIAWDTVAPTIVAYPEGGGDPLWSSRLLDFPGKQAELRAMAAGPEGTLLVTAQDVSGYFRSWVFAVDEASGAVLWSFDYTDLPIDRVWTSPAAIAASDSRILVTGFWSYLDGDNANQQVVQAYALGFDLDGTMSCYGTYDEYDPNDLDGLRSFASMAVEADANGDFVLAGYTAPYFDVPLPTELLLAHVRG